MSVDVTTFHDDNSRDGADLQETTLTPSDVNPSTFGRVGFFSTDGKVDAQPLYVSGVTIPGQGTHNVAYVATENDSVYAFDADDGQVLWHDGPSGTPTSILPAGQGPLLAADFPKAAITGRLGILATPVIDPSTGTIYVVATSESAENGGFVAHDEIAAIDISTGAMKASHAIDSSITYSGTNPVGTGTTLVFHPEYQKEREALTLVNGVVYTGWTALVFGPPYTGWLMGFNAGDLSVASVLNINPDGSPVSNSPAGTSGSDFWNSGDGFAVDAAGNLFNTTSNGPFDPSVGDYGDTFLKIPTAGGATKVTDSFTPFDQQFLADKDVDLGSSGVIVLPDMKDASGNTVQLAISGSKSGSIYVVDRNNMGGYNTASNDNRQYLDDALGAAEADSPAYYNGTVYFGALGMPLTAWTFTDGVLSGTATSSSTVKFAYPGTSPSISADGNTDGIVWTLDNDPTDAVLYAFDANNLSDELYDSNQAPGGRDQFGPDSTFITPMVANGKVYVGTPDGVAVFGLLPTTGLTTTPPPPSPPPAVLVPAFATPNQVVGGFDVLGVIGSDPVDGDGSLTYTWSAVSIPAGTAPPTFSSNGTNGSQVVAVNYASPGAYTFQVAVQSPSGLVSTSLVTVQAGLSSPGVLIPAFSSPVLKVGKVGNLGVVGSDPVYGERSLTYSWSPLSLPSGAAPPKFSARGTNASKLVDVTFSKAGEYALRVTIVNPVGEIAESHLVVYVNPAVPVKKSAGTKHPGKK